MINVGKVSAIYADIKANPKSPAAPLAKKHKVYSGLIRTIKLILTDKEINAVAKKIASDKNLSCTEVVKGEGLPKTLANSLSIARLLPSLEMVADIPRKPRDNNSGGHKQGCHYYLHALISPGKHPAIVKEAIDTFLAKMPKDHKEQKVFMSVMSDMAKIFNRRVINVRKCDVTATLNGFEVREAL